MRLPDDDEIYDVDQTYLGPPGRYIGRFRYRALAIGPLVIILGLALLMRTGIGFSLLSVALTVMASIRFTQWIVDKTSQERPVGVLVKTFGHELTARRAPAKGWRSNRVRAFRQRTTQIGDAHEIPIRPATAFADVVPDPAAGAFDGSVARLRWRNYANAAASRKGNEA